ncbi:hypothetical protein Pcinc_035825 [Petrolisthes cinctipes]|uniref:Endonuclease/exonuclease/phosphatase domain-containing protein n=1 Tax=Petrolisthes cinctipes TaxID=88211 RepID=A0AAE1EMK7_PETCI|nr:hypothetical protein Pcinc_035825 [Petrolisthes cinctipes]
MSVEGASHRLIDRPAGIPEYLPRQWCAVCGLKITDTIRSQKCIERGCPNISHTACLDNEPEFNCANTQELRVLVGIRGQVTFRPLQVTLEPVRSTPLRPSVSVEEEDLVDLTREELKVLLLTLRKDLSEGKEQIKVYSVAIDKLTDKRSVLAEALEIVDSFISLRENSRGKTDLETISCTARPDKIDKGWAEHISVNAEAREWWATVGDRGDRGSNDITGTPNRPESIPGSSLAVQVTQNIGVGEGGSGDSVLSSASSPACPTLPHNPPPRNPRPNNPPPSAPPPSAPPPRAPPTRNSPPRIPPQHLPPSLVHPIQTQPDQRPQTVRGNKHYPQGSSHQWSSQGRRRPPRGQIHNNTARVTEERPTSERLPQIMCSLCHRKDHSEEQCPKHLTCEYCQGRFHTERTCKERQADRRHQDLIQAVRLGSQETLAVLRGAAWRLPSQQLNNTWGTRPTPGVGLYNSHYPYHQGTFLDNNVTSGYARIKGYSSWVRKDRSTLGGGVALCFKNSLRVVVLDTPIPADLEVIIWKVCGDKDIGILCVGCYRSPSQGTALIDYLLTNLDRLMTDHHCNFVIILGDLNQRGIQHSFDSLLAVFNLQNYVTFPTHRSGSSIDPVVTDLPSHEIQCSSMGPVGSSDHEAILTKITFKRPRDESITRTLWQ